MIQVSTWSLQPATRPRASATGRGFALSAIALTPLLTGAGTLRRR